MPKFTTALIFFALEMYVLFVSHGPLCIVAVRAPKRNLPDERISVSQTVKAKAMDALKVSYFCSRCLAKLDENLLFELTILYERYDGF